MEESGNAEVLRYWMELIRLLPESWSQKRTITMNYVKLNECSGKDYSQLPNFIQWARTLEVDFIFPDET